MIKAQFMQMWDGLETTNDIVVVMGATNRSAHISFYLLTTVGRHAHLLAFSKHEFPPQKLLTQYVGP